MAKKETAAKRSTKSAGDGDEAKDAAAKGGGTGGSGKGRVNPALMKPLQPSNELAEIVGKDPLPRPQMVKKVWDYIKANELQNPENRREIVSDDKLRAVFGKDKVTMFEMNKHLAAHLK
jgi:chromatin remodeling complex protein RSC6